MNPAFEKLVTTLKITVLCPLRIHGECFCLIGNSTQFPEIQKAPEKISPEPSVLQFPAAIFFYTVWRESFVLHRSIPVTSAMGYARKTSLLHREFNLAMKNKTLRVDAHACRTVNDV